MDKNKNTVVLKACEAYDEAVVQAAVDEIFALCGGVESFVEP